MKLAKTAVKYTSTGTRSEHCAICMHYQNRTTCKIVAGPIVPQGWCNQFKRKTNLPLAMPVMADKGR